MKNDELIEFKYFLHFYNDYLEKEGKTKLDLKQCIKTSNPFLENYIDEIHIKDKSFELEKTFENLKKNLEHYNNKRNLNRKNDISIEDELTRYLFPHILEKDIIKQKTFIELLIKKFFKVILNEKKENDIDHYNSKRAETSGTLFRELFEKQYIHYLSILKKTLTRKYFDNIDELKSIIEGRKLDESKRISSTMKYALINGKWGKNKSDPYLREGVTQPLDVGKSYLAKLSQLRRLKLPIDEENKDINLRKLHTSQYGYVCPIDTPEGGQVGITLNYSLLTKVSVYRDELLLKNKLLNHKRILEYFDPNNSNDKYSVNINSNRIGYINKYNNDKMLKQMLSEINSLGIQIDDISVYENEINILMEGKTEELKTYFNNNLFDCGTTFENTIVLVNNNIIGSLQKENVNYFIDYFNDLRDLHKIEYDISIFNNIRENEINIYCDEGRLIRPLFKLNNYGNLRFNQKDELCWDTLIKQNYIVYLDPNESTREVIALWPDELIQNKYKYCEIHPSIMLSVIGNTIPFIENIPTSRSTFQCSMGKQAMTNFEILDSKGNSIGLPYLDMVHRYDTVTKQLVNISNPLYKKNIYKPSLNTSLQEL